MPDPDDVSDEELLADVRSLGDAIHDAADDPSPETEAARDAAAAPLTDKYRS